MASGHAPGPQSMRISVNSMETTARSDNLPSGAADFGAMTINPELLDRTH
jgi:hypothetical protein